MVLAESGRKGLKLFRRERPDVIVLDLKMPEMDGMAVLQQVRNLNPSQPVIILTGAELPEAEERLRAYDVSKQAGGNGRAATVERARAIVLPSMFCWFRWCLPVSFQPSPRLGKASNTVCRSQLFSYPESFLGR